MENARNALEYILTPSLPVFLVGTLIVLLVPILVHILVVRKTPFTSLPTILLVGPAGVGKTAFLTLLERGDKAALTHTSQRPQSVELTVSDHEAAQSFREAAKEDAPGTHRKFVLVDTPGHGKLRNMAMHALAGREIIKGVIFMLDASALDETLAATASYLYDVLLTLQKRMGTGRTSRTPSSIHVLVASNKADLFTALPAPLVKTKLEAELGRIRQSRSQGLLDSGVGPDDIDNEENDDWLGGYGSEKFVFSQMREFDTEVDVLNGSVLDGEVSRWWKWISERV